MSNEKFFLWKNKVYADGLRKFLESHNLPTGDLSSRDYYDADKRHQLERLHSVSGSSIILKNWMNETTPISAE